MKRSIHLIAAFGLCACGGVQGFAPGGTAAARPASGSGSGYISHIVLIVQENRTFDDLFATFPGADGATTGKWKNRTLKLRKTGLSSCDFPHTRSAFLKDYANGRMNGFGSESDHCGYSKNDPYQYVDPKDIASYWDIAEQYVLADHMFQSQGSGSFSAHQYLIRGGASIDPSQTQTLVDFPTRQPWGCDAAPHTVTSLLAYTSGGLKYESHTGPFPCSNDFPYEGASYKTLRDLLDAQGISWKYYSPAVSKDASGAIWNAFDMIYSVRYGSEWQNNISTPETNVFNDISNGTLAQMNWIVPSYNNSDHPGLHQDYGPSWVASLVNAIGQSQYWNSTAIVIVWDDWGGFYDHEPPPFLDNYGGLGFRVPMMVVSPYARETSSSQPGYISHTQYEFGSIIKFVENTWNLGSLGTTDQRAANILDCFDFTQQPRSFTSIPSSRTRSYFERQRASGEPVDTE